MGQKQRDICGTSANEMPMLILLPRRQTEPNQQAPLASQIQVCQYKHHIQFGNLFSQTVTS